MTDVVIRAAEASDAAFLEEMLVHAANAPDHTDRDQAETLANPNVANYVVGWPRTTDVGVVAVAADGRAIGAAWLRFFSEAEPAFGFVRADIPELAIGIAEEWRGQGVGRALMRSVAESARRRGVERISLSVHRANPAVALYRSEGYRVVKHREHADTMLLDLVPPGPSV